MLTALRVAAGVMLAIGICQNYELILCGLPPTLAPIVQTTAIFSLLFVVREIIEAAGHVRVWWKSRAVKPE